jgi:hypothetical protein
MRRVHETISLHRFHSPNRLGGLCYERTQISGKGRGLRPNLGGLHGVRVGNLSKYSIGVVYMGVPAVITGSAGDWAAYARFMELQSKGEGPADDDKSQIWWPLLEEKLKRWPYPMKEDVNRESWERAHRWDY